MNIQTSEISEIYNNMTFAEFMSVAIIGKHGPVSMDTMLPMYAQAQRNHRVYPAKEPLPDALAALLERGVLAVFDNPDGDSAAYVLTALGVEIFMRMYPKAPVAQA